jgi:myb proto-oncogene protein
MEQDTLRKSVFKIKRTTTSNSNARVAWSTKHDVKLTALVEEYKERKWKKVAERMQQHFNDKELTAKKCREHWYNFTDPKLNKTSLTEAEELFILVYHHKHKNKWAIISQYLPSRNNNKIKNNFSSLIKRVCRKISLRITEEVPTMLEYIKFLYSISFICILLEKSEKKEEITAVTSLYLYEHIMEKSMSVQQCIQYATSITKAYIKLHPTRTELQRFIVIVQQNQIEGFLVKIFEAVKKAYNPASTFTDNDLITLVEDQFRQSNFEIVNTSLISANTSPLPSAFINSPPYYPPFRHSPDKFLESIMHQIQEPHSAHYSVERTSEVRLPIPSFASPAFQAYFQSLTPGLSPSAQGYSPMMSSESFTSLPAPTARNKGGRSLAIPIFTPKPNKESENKSSQFSVFTNYLQ